MGDEEQATPLDFSDLEGKSVEEVLKEGQRQLFIQLVGRVRAGEANHQEMAILRNLLKDNGLTLGIPQEAPAEQSEPLDLPEFDDPEYHDNVVTFN